MRTAFRWLIILTFALSMSIAVAAQEAAPFVYFYSYDDLAFIIQRADGSDRRILTEYATPRPPDPEVRGGNIEGPGWSASGQWFVWMTDALQEAVLVNRDGSIRRSIAEGFEVERMRWNPVSDLLLLELPISHAVGYNWYEQIRIYDPAKDEIIVSMDLTSMPFDLIWSTDGRAFAYVGQRGFHVYDVEGDLRFTTPSAPTLCLEGTLLPYWLNASVIAYQDITGNLIIQNVYTGNSTHVIKAPGLEIRAISWSPDKQYALVYVDVNNSEDFSSSLGLILPTNDSLSPIFRGASLRNTTCDSILRAWNTNQQAVYFGGDFRLTILSASTQDVMSLPYTSIRAAGWVDDNIVFVGESVDDEAGSHLYRYNPADGSIPVLDDTAANYISQPRGDLVIYGDTILDISSGEHHKIFSHTPEGIDSLSFNAQHVVWHPTEDWVIAGSGIADWQLLDIHVADFAGTTETHLGGCRKNEASCYGWLPPEIVSD